MNLNESPILYLPDELLIHIFDLLPPICVLSKVSAVCRRFHALIDDQKYWKRKIKCQQKIRLSECELNSSGFCAKKAFVAVTKDVDRWENWDKQKIKSALGHSATVDSVLVFKHNSKNFCLSGSRDRSMKLWDLQNVQNGENTVENNWMVASKEGTHEGWIWNVARGGDLTFATTSWDSTVRSWVISDSDIMQTSSINVGSAAQCVSYLTPNELVCTTFAKRVAVVDSRSCEIVADHKMHKRAVIGLAIVGNYIYTSGEDRILMMVDRRNMSKALLFNYSPKFYMTSLTYHRNQLLSATSDGFVRMYDHRNLRLLHGYKVGDFTRQTMFLEGSHMVMSKKTRYQFSVHTPGLDTRELCRSNEFEAEPAKFSYCPKSEILAIGNGDSSILFAFPGEESVN